MQLCNPPAPREFLTSSAAPIRRVWPASLPLTLTFLAVHSISTWCALCSHHALSFCLSLRHAAPPSPAPQPHCLSRSASMLEETADSRKTERTNGAAGGTRTDGTNKLNELPPSQPRSRSQAQAARARPGGRRDLKFCAASTVPTQSTVYLCTILCLAI